MTAHPRATHDWYVEPAWAVEALFRAEPFRPARTIYDPAAGIGTILDVAQRHNYEAIGSDLVKRRRDDAITTPWNYLVRGDYVPRPDIIVCNPPFRLAEAFIRQAMKPGSVQWKAAFLLRLSFLEGQARLKLWTDCSLARVHVFAQRVSMPPGDSGVKPTGGAVAFAWYVFDRHHRGPPQIGWLTKGRT
jgi:hypothetical protein